jgi:hypothetical protein
MPGGYLRGWTPLEQLPFEQLDPAYIDLHETGNCDVQVWKSNRYEVTVRIARDGNSAGIMHLSVNLIDRSPMRNWRHLQQIKNEVCGELWTGIEFFPPEDALTDTANQYHLFCFPPGAQIGTFMEEAFKPIGLGGPEGSLVSDDEHVAWWNNHGGKGRQEPWEEGLTTGRTDHSEPARGRLNELVDAGGLGPK